MAKNKYPSIKFTKEAWKRILPIVREWGCEIDFTGNIDYAEFIVSNYGNPSINTLIIGYSLTDNIYGRRYLVNTEDEFLSAVAKLAGKVYSSSKSSASSIVLKKTNKVTLNFNI